MTESGANNARMVEGFCPINDEDEVRGDPPHPVADKTEEADATVVKAKVIELSKLGRLEYEMQRAKAAEEIGIRVSALDRAVAETLAKDEAGPEDPFEDVEPADNPVDGKALLDELHHTIRRFCILPEGSAPLMAAWVMHAWAHDAADISPVLALTSPEKRCGKTTAVSVLSALVPRAMHAVNISASVLFRVIETHGPTVMIDEGDTFLRDDKNADTRGMLNGGHNRLSAYVWRSHGDDHEPRRFRVWAPKVIAMIGSLPDTLEDRSLVVRLRRKRDGETVERFRADKINDFHYLRRKAARWAQDNALTLANADPTVPNELNDRAQDNARCICAIADVAGGDWPALIRTSLVAMSKEVEADEPTSAGVLLLKDVAEIFEGRKAERIGSTDLVNALIALENAPWSEWRGGRPITARGVAKLLKEYGIRPAQDRIGSFYRPWDFADAFDRYLSGGTKKSTTSTASATASLTDTEKQNKINGRGTCGDCGTISGRGGCNHHSDAYGGEV